MLIYLFLIQNDNFNSDENPVHANNNYYYHCHCRGMVGTSPKGENVQVYFAQLLYTISTIIAPYKLCLLEFANPLSIVILGLNLNARMRNIPHARKNLVD